MVGYKWSTGKDVNYVNEKLEKSHKILQNKSRLYVEKILFFTIVVLLEPKELDFVSIRTNAKYYVRHTTILIGRLKTKEECTYYTGISIFDILDRLFFIILTLIGVWYVSNSILSGLVLSVFVYIVLFLLSKEKDCQKLNFIKKIINWDTWE